ncbi:MAG: hypothetical protein CMJ94_15985 [Planctomycetes bacterium]|nr:hypothetical protein [Planctomycetota bacterium]
MQLSVSIFGAARRPLQDLQEEARELGFAGVHPVPGDLPEDLPSQIEPGVWRFLPSSALEAPPTPDQPPLTLHPARAQAWVEQLREKQVSSLVIELGLLRDVGWRARGDRLLEDLRTEGRLTMGAEAVESLQKESEQTAEQELEEAARFLHAFQQAAPGLRLAVAIEDHPAALLSPERFRLLRQEAGLGPLGYWHDSARAQARAALQLDQPGDWLDQHAGILVGVTLHDWAEGLDRRLIGDGVVDFRLLSEYLPRDAARVLTAAPVYPKELLPAARDALAAAGLH